MLVAMIKKIHKNYHTKIIIKNRHMPIRVGVTPRVVSDGLVGRI